MWEALPEGISTVDHRRSNDGSEGDTPARTRARCRCHRHPRHLDSERATTTTVPLHGFLGAPVWGTGICTRRCSQRHRPARTAAHSRGGLPGVNAPATAARPYPSRATTAIARDAPTPPASAPAGSAASLAVGRRQVSKYPKQRQRRRWLPLNRASRFHSARRCCQYQHRPRANGHSSACLRRKRQPVRI